MENLKGFVLKLINYLFETKCYECSFPRNNSSYHIKSCTFSQVENDINRIWEEKSKTKYFFVEIFQNSSGVLVEKWSFKLSNEFEHASSYYDYVSALRSFAAISKLHQLDSTEPRSVYIKNHESQTLWPSNADIFQFPSNSLRLQSSEGCLEINSQFLKTLQPQLIIQSLGCRPRLTSVGSVDNKELAVFMSEAVIENTGINLICSEYTDNNSEFCEEEYGNNSFDLEIDIVPTNDTPEEAKISIFMLNCDKMRELALFVSEQKIDAMDILKKYKN